MSGGAGLIVAELLAILSLIALVLALWLFIRRAGRLVAETRAVEGFRREAADLTSRIEASLAGVSGRIDGVRRQTVPADAIAENLTAAREAVDRYAEEARALRGPRRSAEIREGIVAELERAARALEMTEHGCSILTSARGGNRELEAQTAVKRGYLNLLHAREAIARHAARAAQLRAGETTAGFERRNA